ncbi:Crp/Fnr family transcriptional regulator [Dehalogenimonas etheniformans]|uniref:Crp/Fnr family transcriptional regulator n=1 Tax=Dehalogenimonas etheniformans TaxID=1536648 RepID=A0A2P5P9L4_9CHLR|nr:Crp/Fnr family transcriptional regulator [Dehalogenimonas etheniformans]PPD58996.1 Crp/Fnr family transcriptional regulator [Dehalogenimonas etheniformans]QNT76237.1 Crp/Fnr family transcriptional regulator [Dehalogenimonas etheniformans]
MADILHTKNASTRFQIMVEIASKGPAIEQKTIAANLSITPQAISDYLKHMTADGLVAAEGRSRYRVTSSGVNWMLKELRALNDYVNLAERAVTDISVNAALAEGKISEGQEVGLVMREGILSARPEKNGGAWGLAAQNAESGEDVGISGVKGIIPLKLGRITLVSVPGILEGGSRSADLSRLKSLVEGKKHVAAAGIEAYAALRKIAVEPRYFYAVPQVAVEALRYGLEVVIVAVAEEIPALTKVLSDAEIKPHLIDLRIK